mgnify:FL=1
MWLFGVIVLWLTCGGELGLCVLGCVCAFVPERGMIPTRTPTQPPSEDVSSLRRKVADCMRSKREKFKPYIVGENGCVVDDGLCVLCLCVSSSPARTFASQSASVYQGKM